MEPAKAKKPENKAVARKREKKSVPAEVLEKEPQNPETAVAVAEPPKIKRERKKKISQKAENFIKAENVRAELERLSARGENRIEKQEDVDVVEKVNEVSSQKGERMEISPEEELELQSFFKKEKNEKREKAETGGKTAWDGFLAAFRDISAKISSAVAEISSKVSTRITEIIDNN